MCGMEPDAFLRTVWNGPQCCFRSLKVCGMESNAVFEGLVCGIFLLYLTYVSFISVSF